jgi:hypothetical protein
MNGLRGRFIVGGALLALSLLAAPGCRSVHEARKAAAPAAANPEAAQKAVLDRDSAKIQAMVHADAKALGEILRDDLIYIHSSGPVDNKERVIDEITSGLLQYSAVETSEVWVRIYGDTSVVAGRALLKVSTKGKALEIPVRFTEVWVRSNGVWQLASWQATRIP